MESGPLITKQIHAHGSSAAHYQAVPPSGPTDPTSVFQAAPVSLHEDIHSFPLGVIGVHLTAAVAEIPVVDQVSSIHVIPAEQLEHDEPITMPGEDHASVSVDLQNDCLLCHRTTPRQFWSWWEVVFKFGHHVRVFAPFASSAALRAAVHLSEVGVRIVHLRVDSITQIRTGGA